MKIPASFGISLIQYKQEFPIVSGLFAESTVLSGVLHEHHQLLQTWTGRNYIATELCWRASRDGWIATTFHTRCDNKQPTITLIKVDQYIFGFYVTKSWHGKIADGNNAIAQNNFILIYIFYSSDYNGWMDKKDKGLFYFLSYALPY